MDGPPRSSGHQLDDEDEEVEAIKQQIKFTKQESLSSTRNALRIAREAEETARNTMNRLGEQSGIYTSLHLPIRSGYVQPSNATPSSVFLFRP